MYYEDLQLKLLRLLKAYWNRVISLDIETHVTEGFLRDERILSISFARRVSGNLMDAIGIEINTFFLNDETDESEKQLLEVLDKELGISKPLGVLGYGLRQYDIPLLIMKKQYYNARLWKLIDITESAVHIDLYHLLKYKRYRNLENAISAQEFADLPLKRAKTIIPSDRGSKGEKIYTLWKNHRDVLKRYAEGDVHDTLLLAEKLMSQ